MGFKDSFPGRVGETDIASKELEDIMTTP